jgi:hypothetical protein
LSLRTFITAMTDYQSIIARAVSTLDPNTEETRRRLYERARSALISEMYKPEPALDRSDIMAAQMSLELAIGEVEAEAQREQRREAVLDRPSHRDGGSWRPSFPANENDEQARGLLTRLWARFFRRAGEIGGEKDGREGRDTWLTELLARASREENEDYQDFAPKRASANHA